jgi:hypothetical protein
VSSMLCIGSTFIVISAHLLNTAVLSSLEISKNLSSCSQLEDIAMSLDRGSNVVVKSLSYSECYPAIDIFQLIHILDELQSTIVDLARLSRKPSELYFGFD